MCYLNVDYIFCNIHSIYIDVIIVWWILVNKNKYKNSSSIIKY